MSEKITVRIGNKRKTFTSVKDAAKALKMDYGVLYQRLFVMNWPISKAINTKVVKKPRKAKRKKAKR